MLSSWHETHASDFMDPLEELELTFKTTNSQGKSGSENRVLTVSGKDR